MTAKPAQTLDGRLLCASVTAYGIHPFKPFDPQDNYVIGAGFPSKDAIQTFVAGPEEINACILGQTSDGLVLAFRGTLPLSVSDPPSFIDWLNDFYAEPLLVNGIPGAVHSGFWDALESLWQRIEPAVKVAKGDLPLYITGHSKGGALASLAAMRFAKQNGIPVQEVHTFASPRAGDFEFASAYDELFTDIRWEYQDDIVPHMPPDLMFMNLLRELAKLAPWIAERIGSWDVWDYTSVGLLKFIDWSNQVITVDHPPDIPLDLDRAWHLGKLLAELKLQQIAADHGASCGQGYMDVIVPVNVCPTASAHEIATLVGKVAAASGVDQERQA